MKRSKPHNVYLSRQSIDIMIALKTCAGNSRYVLPSRYDADAPMSRATFNRITTAVVVRAKQQGLPLEPFTVHDLRRTGSTLLNELGFNRDWIEKCLAHEEGKSSRGVYNKADYEQQRRHIAPGMGRRCRRMGGRSNAPADALSADHAVDRTESKDLACESTRSDRSWHRGERIARNCADVPIVPMIARQRPPRAPRRVNV